MKAKIVSKLPLVIGLALVLLVCCLAYLPIAEGASTFIGGWNPGYYPTCCNSPAGPQDCNAWWGCDEGGFMAVCYQDVGPGTCGPDKQTPHPCSGNEECNATWNGKCFGVE